jgi:glycosyltransferase involved in cell wall biosynthesis
MQDDLSTNLPSATGLQGPLILHLSADYPDSFRNRTTLAVRNLIAATPGFEHAVVSLKRHALPWRTYLRKEPRDPVSRVFAFGYWGLPFGIAHLASMWLAARRIRALLAEEGIRPQVIHAHKLSFEGIIAWLLARRLGVPFVASLRGEAETKIVRWKPSYRPLIARVARDARIIFAVSMWFVPELRRVAPSIDGKIRPLPNLVGIPDTPKQSRMRPAPRFVSILDLNVYRKKGFHWLIPAFAVAARKHPDATLDVFGWSNERVDAELRLLVAAAGCGSRVRFRGLRPHAQILDELPKYAALLLPSVNETFGMVYLEALFAGVPVLYTKGTGIDGHLDGLSVGAGVPAGSIDAIAAAIDDFCRNGARWRDAVRRQRPELEARFGQAGIVARYTGDILSLLERSSHREGGFSAERIGQTDPLQRGAPAPAIDLLLRRQLSLPGLRIQRSLPRRFRI